MTDLKEIASNPNYDAAASGASKATITVFAATFAYMVLFGGVSPGWLGGAVFFVVGMFAVSLLISMPLFLLKSKAPRIAGVATVLDIGLTVLVTRFALLWLFGQSNMTESPPNAETLVEPRSFICEEPLPEFTLSATANPSDEELAELCACIHGALGPDDRELSSMIAAGQESMVNPNDIQAFIPRFGDAIQHCGGYRF